MMRGAMASVLSVARRPMTKLALYVLKRLPPEHRAYAIDVLLREAVLIETPHGGIRFLNHGPVSCRRAQSLLTKEPDSLKWIDAMQPGSVFWDIGANVGVLSLYAASRGDLQIWAFEPAAVNYYNLVANCELNHFEDRIRCLQLGFSNDEGISDLHVSQLMPAHSFTFRRSTKQKAKRRPHSSLQAVQICTIDDFIARHQTPCPNYIKIDVPGLTPGDSYGSPTHLISARPQADSSGGKRAPIRGAPHMRITSPLRVQDHQTRHETPRASPGGSCLRARPIVITTTPSPPEAPLAPGEHESSRFLLLLWASIQLEVLAVCHSLFLR